jgi:hypothetical protein
METPVKHSASELRAMLKEHKASMPRLSSKKAALMEYAGKFGLLKAAETPRPPSPPPEAPAQKKKSATTVVVPVSSKKADLPAELKKPEPKKEAPKEAAKAVAAPAKKSFSEGAKGGLAAYASFVGAQKARGMSHKEAVAAWKSRK